MTMWLPLIMFLHFKKVNRDTTYVWYKHQHTTAATTAATSRMVTNSSAPVSSSE